MYVTFSDLFTFVIMITGIVALIYQIQNKEFRLRNSRAERGRFSDKYPLRASAHPAERFV